LGDELEEDRRKTIDDKFLNNINYCDNHNFFVRDSCKLWAIQYYEAIRLFGNF